MKMICKEKKKMKFICMTYMDLNLEIEMFAKVGIIKASFVL